MECERVASLEDHKLRIDSLAVVPRRRGGAVAASSASGGALGSDLAATTSMASFASASSGNAATGASGGDSRDLVYGLCVGTSDGCVTLYAVSPSPGVTASGATPGSQLFSNAKRIHKRSLDCGKAPVTALLPETRLKDPRLVCLCNGKVSVLNAEHFDPIPTFAAMKELEGVSLICLAQPAPGTAAVTGEDTQQQQQQQQPASKVGFAAVVKQRVHLYELSNVSASPFVSTTGQALVVGEGTTQLEWTGPYIIVGTKRDYCVYDARTHQLHDQLVFGRGQPQSMLRPFPDGAVAVRHGTQLALWGPERGTTFETAAALPLADPPASAAATTALEDLTFVGRCHPFLVMLHASGKIQLRSLFDQGSFPVAPALPTTQSGGVRCGCDTSGAVFVATSREVFGLVPATAMTVVQRYIGAGLLRRATAHYAAALQPSEPTPVAMRRFETGLKEVHLSCAREAVRLGQLDAALTHFGLSDCDATDILKHFPQLCWRGSGGGGGGTNGEAEMSIEPASHTITFNVSSGGGGKASSSGGAGGKSATTTAAQEQSIAAIRLLDLLKKKHRVRDDTGNYQQRAVDFALLMLLLGDCISDAVMGDIDRRDEIDALFLPSNNLPTRHVLTALSALSGGVGAAPPRMYDRARILLLATHGEAPQALAAAKEKQLVEEATLVLQNKPTMTLVTQHLPWMLVRNAPVAVSAVCVRDANLSPAVVLGMLAGCGTSVVRQYLSFAIHENGTQDTELHTQYACALIRELEPLRGLHDMSGFKHIAVAPGDEAGLYGDLRRELLLFLGGSRCYDGDTVLAALRNARRSDASPFGAYDDDAADTTRDGGGAGDDDGLDWDAGLPGSSNQKQGARGGAAADGGANDVRRRLARFYQKYNPGHMGAIDDVLSRYGGRHEELFAALVSKYGPEPPASDDDVDDESADGSSPSDLLNMSIARRRERRERRRVQSRWLMHEEALVHARHGDHTATLSIYVYRLGDLRLAEQYCFSAFVTDAERRLGGSPARRAGTTGRTGVKAGASGGAGRSGTSLIAKAASKVGGAAGAAGGDAGGCSKRAAQSARISAALSELVVVLLIPPDGYKARESDALRVLDAHSASINPTSVLEAMPGDVAFKSIAPYIARVAVRHSHLRTMTEVQRESLRTHVFELQRMRIALHRRSIFVDRDRVCVVCKKPLGNTIFGVFPNLKAAHFRCFRSRECDPVRGVAFKPVVEPLYMVRSGVAAE